MAERPAPREQLYTVDELAEILRCSKSTAYLRAHEMRRIQQGKHILIPASALDDWLKAHELPPRTLLPAMRPVLTNRRRAKEKPPVVIDRPTIRLTQPRKKPRST